MLADGSSTYLYGLGRIGEQQAGGWVYHLGDALGSVRQLADASVNVTLARSYEPFGDPLMTTGTGSSIYGFTGEQRDGTGLVYLRARYYGPAFGRFLSRDPWEGDPNQPMSYNVWLYVYANPVNVVDPSGLVSIHNEVVIRYAYRYGFQPHYRIPSIVPPSPPRTGRWGRVVDLVDWSRFEIYEVEPNDPFVLSSPRHGIAQLELYLRLLNQAQGGIGTAFVNQWRPGVRAGEILFTTWAGAVEVRARLMRPGLIVYEARPTRRAKEIAVDVCHVIIAYAILRAAGLQVAPSFQPQTGAPGFFLPVPVFKPLPQ